MEHTKGEWKIHKITKHNETHTAFTICVDKGHDVDVVAAIKDDFICQASAEANARLIAAGPDLLEACEYADKALNICLRYLLGTGPQPNPEELSEAPIKLKAAITKATKE